MNSASGSESAGINRLRDNYITQAWLVLLLATFFGALLSGIDITLSPTIEANKLNESLQRVPALVKYEPAGKAEQPPGGELNVKRLFVDVAGPQKSRVYTVFHASAGARTVGWVAKASGQGYADKVEVLIGLDPTATTITGLFVLDQKETPGLGSKIVDSKWLQQFAGKGTDLTLTAVKKEATAPGEIDAITGATISSETVCDIVNRAVDDLRNPLSQKVVDADVTVKQQRE